MKVIAIIGSLRKGNGYRVTKQLEEKLKQFAAIEFDYCFLKEADIEQCRGCMVCFTQGDHLCPLNDSINNLKKQMLSSDGIIFVSSVYAGQVSSMMKIFLERFDYLVHRPCFFEQSALVISTAGTAARINKTLNYLRHTIEGWGFKSVHTAGFWTPPFPVPPVVKQRSAAKLGKTAKQFFNSIKNKNIPAPGLSRIRHFNVFKAYVALPITKEYFPYNFKYWKSKGWLNRRYYYVDIKINFIIKFYAWIMRKISRYMAQRFFR